MSSTANANALHAVPVALACACLAGCAEVPSSSGRNAATPVGAAQISILQLLSQPGGTCSDNAPDGTPPVDLERIDDATTKAEPLHPSANEPSTVFGRDYVPMSALAPYRRQGTCLPIRTQVPRSTHHQRRVPRHVRDERRPSHAADSNLCPCNEPGKS